MRLLEKPDFGEIIFEFHDNLRNSLVSKYDANPKFQEKNFCSLWMRHIWMSEMQRKYKDF